MKIIYPELQATPTVDSEDANYPIANLVNNIRKKVWKAVNGVNVATVTVGMAAGANVIALYNSNAVSASCVIKNSVGGTVETVAHTLTYGKFWQEFTTQAGVSSAEITLTSAVGTTVEAGIVRGGVMVSIKDPGYDIQETRDDYSIKKELNNGGMYTNLRDIIKTFSFGLVTTRTEFDSLMAVYDEVGVADPLAFLITDNDTDDNKWTVFARFGSTPSGTHSAPTLTPVSINLVEVV